MATNSSKTADPAQPRADGRCTADSCRAIPETFCYRCEHWFCPEHANHVLHSATAPPMMW